MPVYYPAMNVEKLYRLVMSTFPGVEAPKARNNDTICSLIKSYIVHKLDYCDHDAGLDRYRSTENLMMN